MGKSLVIVESPAKAKTINKYLGKEFIVKSSVGHIRDLPTSGSATASTTKKTTKEKRNEQEKLVSRMGINPYDNWKAHYEILPGKESIVKELTTLAKDVEYIYLATDLDREGEAIAWHLQEVIGGDKSRYRRVVFNEITKNAIKQAFNQPTLLNLDRVNAQQARRFMDRVVGYMVSPLLWKKVARGLSAGRVQSVAVRLIVEREQEIKTFTPEEYWEIKSECHASGNQPLMLQVVQYQGVNFRPINQSEMEQALAILKKATYQVIKQDHKPVIQHAPAPFITSTLQQAASTRLNFGVKKTMLLAQRLYEAGYITYMRTDSTNLSQDAIAMARNYVLENYGEVYLPKDANIYASKNNAQEAHEAIRPSDVTCIPQQIVGLEQDAQRLYEIIWKQFLACQMSSAQYDATTITVNAADYTLKARGRVLRFDGWTKIISPSSRKSNDNIALPIVKAGEELLLAQLLPSQHFTKPSPRFNEASLVKELEKRGIGRPSTYASIISTIKERGYVRVENRRFYAEKMGEIVTNRLKSSFNELMDYDFTAKMEDQLDDIAEKQVNWIQVLDSFFKNFNIALLKAETPPEEGGMELNSMVLTSLACPSCNRPMGIRTATTGVFLGCSGYALPKKEQCKQTINLIPELEVFNLLEDESEVEALLSRHRCALCGTAMDSYLIDSTKKIHICGNNPECSGVEIEEGNFKIKGYEGPVVECDKCGAEMHLKLGRFGKYMGCTNPECKNTRKILKSGEIAPPREEPIPLPELKCVKSDAYFVLRDGASGLFLAANNFPKSRETRAPLVAELIKFKELLPEKLRYLTQAPPCDPEGNLTILRFSRKTKQQYVSSEKDGKATGWSLFYVNNKWQEK